jgi:nucleotide-binding universal stress UspA family protein
MQRVLIVCHDLQKSQELLARGVAVAKEREAGITVLFVHEVELFNFFGSDDFDKAAVEAKLKEELQSLGVRDAAVLVEVGDSADWVEQESAREGDTLVVMENVAELSAQILERINVPALVLKKFASSYGRALMATEIAKPTECFEVAKSFAQNVILYMDTLVIPVPTVSSPMVDVTGQMVDAELYEQILKSNKEGLEEFAKEHGSECYFDTFDEELNVNIVALASEKGAELLCVAAIDSGSILGSSVEDILEIATTDVLVCYAE